MRRGGENESEDTLNVDLSHIKKAILHDSNLYTQKLLMCIE